MENLFDCILIFLVQKFKIVFLIFSRLFWIKYFAQKIRYQYKYCILFISGPNKSPKLKRQNNIRKQYLWYLTLKTFLTHMNRVPL